MKGTRMCSKDKKIRELERIIEEQQKIIEKQKEIITELTERVKKLERSLKLNSNNSGKPPSSDGLKKQPRVQSLREKSDKKPGGQPGHRGSTLLQVEAPDLIEQHKISCCPHCKIDLTDEPVIDICKKQIFDIPEIKRPFVTEHQLEIKHCPRCKKRVPAKGDRRAKAPVQYGPNTKAVVSYLNIHNLIPENRVAQIMNDLFGMPISVATVENFSKTCATNVEQVVEHIEEDLKVTPVKGADESGLRVAGKLSWLHSLSSKESVYYYATEKRGDIKKNLKGVVVHDGFVSYYKLENIQHALCNAHHLRELKAVVEIDKEPWARSMIRLLKLGCRVAQERPQNITTEWLTKFKKLYDLIISTALSYHENLGVLKKPKRGRVKRRPGHNLVLRLQKYDNDVLRFLSNPEVPFTNNQAEQSLRMIKVKQNISGCFRTVEGANKFLTIRSYTATAQKQGVKTLDALTHAFQGKPLSLVQKLTN